MRAAGTRGEHLGRPSIPKWVVGEIEELATTTTLSIRQIQGKIAGRASRGIVGEIAKRTRAKQFGQEDDITVVIIERSVAAEESSRAGIKPKLVPASFLMGRRDAFSLWSRSLATIHLGLGKLGSYARV
jgi:hypothetical protein